MILADSSAFDLTVFGTAGTTIAILLYFLKIVWTDNQELRREKDEAQAKSLESVTSVATTASHHLAESSKAMEAATVMMHQLAGRSLSAEQFYQLVSLLRDLRDRPS